MTDIDLVQGKETMLPSVISVEHIEGSRLLLKFDNDELRWFDCEIISELPPYRGIDKMIDQVYADFGTIMWPGDIDVSPETVYLKSIPAE